MTYPRSLPTREDRHCCHVEPFPVVSINPFASAAIAIAVRIDSLVIFVEDLTPSRPVTTYMFSRIFPGIYDSILTSFSQSTFIFVVLRISYCFGAPFLWVLRHLLELCNKQEAKKVAFDSYTFHRLSQPLIYAF